jgi:recombination protein RecA
MSTVEELFGEFNSGGLEVATFGKSIDSVPRLPSDIFQLDLSSGGGFPRGRISVIYGPEGSAKTTLALKAVAQAQFEHPDKKAVFLDAEGHLDGKWANRLGVDMTKLGYAIPQSAENAVDMIEALLYAEDLSIVVLDSLAALTTEKELDSDAEKALVGAGALVINKMYRKTGRALGMAKLQGREPTVIFINQIRMKIGVMYGNPETMPGGPSFKFASSLTIRTFGKDEIDKDVNPSLPAFKEIKCVIKKQKVGIVSENCEFKMAILPNEAKGLKVGDVYEWNTISHYLKLFGLMNKEKGNKWSLADPETGEVTEYKAQYEIEKLFREDKALAQKYKRVIFDRVVADTEGHDEESVPETETGEEQGVSGEAG